VSDVTGTLTAAEKAQLVAKLASLEQAKGSQIAILIVPSTQPETIEQFSIRVVEKWKLGRSTPPAGTVGANKAGGKVNDGVLLLVAKNDRKVRIEVGYGLEGVITDAFAKRIISEQITPRFKLGDFAGGLSLGVDQLTRLIDGEALPAPWNQGAPAGNSGGSGSEDDLFSLLPFLLFAALFAVVLLPRMFGRSLGAMIGGAGVGFLGNALSGSLLLGGVVGVLVLLLVLIFGGSSSTQRLSRQMRRSSSFPVIWGGGGGGGFGGGGSGSDSGFGGGGGDFGGGGASGDW
jgi:uncharacterized protein